MWAKVKLAEWTSGRFLQPVDAAVSVEGVEAKQVSNLVSLTYIIQTYGTLRWLAFMF